MSSFDDTVKAVMSYADKTGDEPRKVAESFLRGVIADINMKLHDLSVSSRVNNIAVAANATTVTMPKACRYIKELGRYESATDRLRPRYKEITEHEFNDRFGNATSIGPIDPTSVNEWFLIDDTTSNERKIRLVYPPNDSFTMMVSYYEKLTESNVDRLDNPDILVNGLMSRLGQWLVRDYQLAQQRYDRQIIELIQAIPTSRRAGTINVRPDIAVHNAIAASLVE